MSWSIESITFKPYRRQMDAFTSSPTGPIGTDLRRRAALLKSLVRTDPATPRKTGQMSRALSVSYARGPVNPSVTISANKRYAYWVHEGTRPHEIFPNNSRILRFKYNGRIVYARKVTHPGSQPRRFMTRHLNTVVR